MTMTVVFNTLAYAEKLKASGVPEEQAKAQATALNEVLSESSGNVLATKLDIAELRADNKIMRWMIGINSAGIGALVLRAFI